MLRGMRKRPTAPLNIVGAQVRAARKRKGFSQAKLAELLHPHGWRALRSVINKIEMGLRCVSDYELVTLSRVLDVTVPQLLRNAPTDVRAIFKSSGK